MGKLYACRADRLGSLCNEFWNGKQFRTDFLSGKCGGSGGVPQPRFHYQTSEVVFLLVLSSTLDDTLIDKSNDLKGLKTNERYNVDYAE